MTVFIYQSLRGIVSKACKQERRRLTVTPTERRELNLPARIILKSTVNTNQADSVEFGRCCASKNRHPTGVPDATSIITFYICWHGCNNLYHFFNLLHTSRITLFLRSRLCISGNWELANFILGIAVSDLSCKFFIFKLS